MKTSKFSADEIKTENELLLSAKPQNKLTKFIIIQLETPGYLRIEDKVVRVNVR